MSQEQAIEAARGRIQKLVEEIAALSKRDLPTEQFLPEFLKRVAQATDARGAAVWLVGQRTAEGKAEFQLAAAHEFESCGFQSDEVQRALILRALTECVTGNRPVALSAMPRDGGSVQAQVAQIQGSPEAQQPKNKTPFPFLHVPLPLKDQVLGVIQVWLQPYVTQGNFGEFATFLAQLAAYVEQHFQSRRLGNLVVETQRLQHLLKFASDIAGSLDPLEVSRLAANYGRDLVGCERCAVLWLDGSRWRVLSISGQEVVEKKSTMVKSMAAFVGAHVKGETVVLSKKALLAAHAASDSPDTPPPSLEKTAEGELPVVPAPRTRTDEIDLAYFEMSHVASGAIAPLLDDDKQIVGAYFAESTTDGFFELVPGAKEQPLAVRMTEFIATHTGKTLRGAQEYDSLPFLFATKRMRATQLAFTGNKRKRSIFRTVLWGGIAAAILFCPWVDHIEGDCYLMPESHTTIVNEVPGHVAKILVHEGAMVKAGDILAELDKRRIEAEIETAQKDIQATEAEADRLRGAGDEAGAQVQYLRASAMREALKNREADFEAATLRSPIDGIVITKDLEKRAGEFIQAGTALIEVASPKNWDLKVDLDQRYVGRLEKRLEGGGIDASYILYSQTAYTLPARVEGIGQLSAAAEPRDQKHVFVITVENVAIPEQLIPAIRPGLTGRAKLELGWKTVGWLWARGLWDWFQMRLVG